MIPAIYPMIVLAVVLAILFAMLVSPYLKSIKNPIAWVVIILITAYAGTKPPGARHLWKFVYQNGVYDNGSYCTNDQIFASWTYDSAAEENVIRAAYQDLTVTNELGDCSDTLHQLPDCLVSDGSHLWSVEGATNMRIVVYSTYVAPPVVNTNGVYHLNGVMRPMNDSQKYVTPGVEIRAVVEDIESTETLTPTNNPTRNIY